MIGLETMPVWSFPEEAKLVTMSVLYCWVDSECSPQILKCSMRCCLCFSRLCSSHSVRYSNAHKLNLDPKNSKTFIFIIGSCQVFVVEDRTSRSVVLLSAAVPSQSPRLRRHSSL